jgi:hypothetical protein
MTSKWFILHFLSHIRFLPTFYKEGTHVFASVSRARISNCTVLLDNALDLYLLLPVVNLPPGFPNTSAVMCASKGVREGRGAK